MLPKATTRNLTRMTKVPREVIDYSNEPSASYLPYVATTVNVPLCRSWVRTQRYTGKSWSREKQRT